jgi:hypothetical protein
MAIFSPYELIAGGGTRYLFNIAEAFRDEYQVYLVTPDKQPKSAIIDASHSVGTSVDHVLPISWE